MKRFYTFLVIAIFLIAFILVFKFTGLETRFLGNSNLLLPAVIIFALIDSINPCAFSVLLLTIAFLFSLGRARGHILRIGLLYILGIFAVYVLIGLGILRALTFLNVPHLIAKLGAVILIAFGIINLINEFWPAFPIKLKIPQSAHGKLAVLIEKSSAPAALGLGILVGLFEFPCTGGPYLAVLGLLHYQATYAKGLAYLILYNLIFVLPLIVILFIASDNILLERVQNWRKGNSRGMKLWTGLAMVFLGILILLIV